MNSRILSVDDLSKSDVSRLFFALRSSPENERFDGRVLVNCFLEPSTRTSMSFSMAAARLGIEVVNFSLEASSLKKGESFQETIATLLAMKPDILVCRTPFTLTPAMFGNSASSIINAGDGINEHPTQALLDCFTILEHFSCDNLQGLSVLIMGDIAHSRVAHSNIKLMSCLGARITLFAPTKRDFVSDVKCVHHFNELTQTFDVVMVLRIQKERMNSLELVSDDDYFKTYGLTEDRFQTLCPTGVLMHPGPMNPGVEISNGLHEHPRSLIRKQVSNGVLVRRELLCQLLRS